MYAYGIRVLSVKSFHVDDAKEQVSSHARTCPLYDRYFKLVSRSPVPANRGSPAVSHRHVERQDQWEWAMDGLIPNRVCRSKR